MERKRKKKKKRVTVALDTNDSTNSLVLYISTEKKRESLVDFFLPLLPFPHFTGELRTFQAFPDQHTYRHTYKRTRSLMNVNNVRDIKVTDH